LTITPGSLICAASAQPNPRLSRSSVPQSGYSRSVRRTPAFVLSALALALAGADPASAALVQGTVAGHLRVIGPEKHHAKPGPRVPFSANARLTVENRRTGKVLSGIVRTGRPFAFHVPPGVYIVKAELGPPIANPGPRPCGRPQTVRVQQAQQANVTLITADTNSLAIAGIEPQPWASVRECPWPIAGCRARRVRIVINMDGERPAHMKMRRAVDALVASDEPMRVRLQAAEKHFGQLSFERELPPPAEQLLYHRIASSLVNGGDDDEGEDETSDEQAALAESIAALNDDVAVMIARDMLCLYELVAEPPDLDAQWPPEWR
jgi:hypothetical protein